MTEVTLKVMPRAEAETTLVLVGLDDVRAGQAMTAALGSPFDVSAAAHLPRAALRGAIAPLAANDATKLIRLEGIAASVAHRADSLRHELAAFGTADRLESVASAAVWEAVRDVTPFAATGPLGRWPVWRIVCPPAAGPGLGQALARETGGEIIYDWGGGLIWLALPPSVDAHAAFLRTRSTRSAATRRCFVLPMRYARVSMCFIRSRRALPRSIAASNSASIRRTFSTAAGWCVEARRENRIFPRAARRS